MNAPLKRPPLPESWVERIFDRMQGLYGSLWVDRWRSGETIKAPDGTTADRGMILAKATWAQELGGFAGEAERIAKALDDCRGRNLPPTLPEFIGLCRQQYVEGPKELPAPALSAEDRQARAAAAEKMAAQVAAGKVDGAGHWSKVLDTQLAQPGSYPDMTIRYAFEALAELRQDTSRWEKIKPASLVRREAEAA